MKKLKIHVYLAIAIPYAIITGIIYFTEPNLHYVWLKGGFGYLFICFGIWLANIPKPKKKILNLPTPTHIGVLYMMCIALILFIIASYVHTFFIILTSWAIGVLIIGYLYLTEQSDNTTK